LGSSIRCYRPTVGVDRSRKSLSIIIYILFAQQLLSIRNGTERIREVVARLNTRLSNNLSGVPVIKSFDRYTIESDRVSDQSRAYRDRTCLAPADFVTVS
jgi:ABC-type multidrug transport system fused ATPase/permease subunit